MDIKQLKRAILTGGFSSAELQELWDTVKVAHRAESMIAAAEFNPGDKVQFTGRRSVVYKGEVVRVKLKNVLVKTTCGHNFNVPATMLKLIPATKKVA